MTTRNGFILKPEHQEIPEHPKRIISLVPSQTELLAYLGLNEEVVGITRFCIFPESWHKHKTRVGGTKKLHLAKIRELQPDLVIANKEENTKEEIEELAGEFPVFVSDVLDLEQAYAMIMDIGELTGKGVEAEALVSELKVRFEVLHSRKFRKMRTAYFIWKNPWMAVGKQVFIDEMMKSAGFENVFDAERYPVFELEELKRMNPELLLLSSEPYPFKEKHIPEVQVAFPDCRIELVNGEIFSWYGNHLLRTPAYLMALREKLDN